MFEKITSSIFIFLSFFYKGRYVGKGVVSMNTHVKFESYTTLYTKYVLGVFSDSKEIISLFLSDNIEINAHFILHFAANR